MQGSKLPKLTNESSTMAPAPRPKVTIPKADHDKLKKAVKDKDAIINKQKATIAKLDRENKEHLKQIESAEDDCQKVMTENDEPKAKFQKPSSKKGKTAAKFMQAEDVNNAIDAHVKDHLFRIVKFAQPGKELNSATQMVWLAIKDKLKLETGPKKLDLAEFTEIYSSHVSTAISDRRQCAQSRSQAAA